MSDKKEPQLHELLAVEKDLKGSAHKILAETEKRFSKADLFKGIVQSFEPFFDEDASMAITEREKLGSTVEERLKYTAHHVAKWWDAVYQKDATNQAAKADIVIGDTVIKDVPATTLLGLETKLKQFRDAIAGMPTLDAKTEWQPAPDEGEYVFVTKYDEVRLRTKKVTEPVVLYEAVIQDGVGIPAQVKESTKDVNIGKYVTKRFSGAVTSARAAVILSRCDEMLAAIKKARRRANNQPIQKGNIGKAIFDQILA